MGIHKGTKLTDAPKDTVIRARVNVKTAEMLEMVCKKTGKSKSEVIRQGIEEQYARLKK